MRSTDAPSDIILGELFGTERLARHGRHLARSQRLVQAPRHQGLRGKGPLLSRLAATERVLRGVHDTLAAVAAEGLEISPAGEWLLDNFYVVLEQVQEVRATLPSDYYHQLPKLEGDGPLAGYPRVYEIAIELIAHTDGRLDLSLLELMLAQYQRITPLTMGELWAMPAMLRMGFLENVRHMSLRAAADAADTRGADAWVTRLLGSEDAGGDALARALTSFINNPPKFSPAFLTRFLQQIRSRRADFTPLLWLEQWIAEEVMTVEEAVQRSTQHLAVTQLVMANSIASLRKIGSIDWSEFVEGASATEAVLRRDPAGVYSGMTFQTRDHYRHVIERLARRTDHAEHDVAGEAIQAAAEVERSSGSIARGAHVGYHLIDDGLPALERSLGYRRRWRETIHSAAHRLPSPFYFVALALCVGGALTLLLDPLEGAKSIGVLAAVLLALVPATDGAVAAVNQLVTLLLPPDRLARMAFKEGVPSLYRGVVVVPILLGSTEAVEDALDHLEAQYLANRDPQIRFALLGDFLDAAAPVMPGDDAIVSAGVEGVRRLNANYSAEMSEGGSPFYYFHRVRQLNTADDCWMGWERKRGKLVQFNKFILGTDEGAFATAEGDTAWLRGVRYVVTLDSDTVLPRDAALGLIGTMAHPLNRAVFDERVGRVVKGYGILQPRVSVSLASANGSHYSAIFAGHPGLDPYTTAVSDVYQDLFREGTFTGKGIYEVAVFERAIEGRFPINALLSHDLIEGSFARAGLVTDIEVFDDYPMRYLTASRRLHRWVRGDWQLAPWLRTKVPGTDGPSVNPLSSVSRWKILDNMRRSVSPVALFVWLVVGWTVLPNPGVAWAFSVLAAMAAPWAIPLALSILRPPRGESWAPYYAALLRDASLSLQQFVLGVVMLPHQAMVAADAVVRTLYRVFVSHRMLLEWQTATQVENSSTGARSAVWARMWPAMLVATAALVGMWTASLMRHGDVGEWTLLAILSICWLIAPEMAHQLSQPIVRADLELGPDERAQALRFAAAHWKFMEHFANADTHWLVPDNFQETPLPVIATRTSPTNIGLQLLCTVSAHDLGFITSEQMLDRLEHALDSIEGMAKVRGHLMNWYDLNDLRVLDPPYVSSVDSGNLAGHLIALSATCASLAEQPATDAERLEGVHRRARALAMAMDFTLFYDERRRLFSIGYDARSGRLDVGTYDLLASEARLGSFIAVAKDDVPAEHWFHLGRSLTTTESGTALVSWSGSMFEYLMPVLVMPSRPYSLLDQTHQAAVRRQIAYGHARGVPWGISESAYNLRDRHDTYQYRAFGVPDLALKRGLGGDLVVAPYASALALSVSPHEALRNMALLERLGAYGPFGFYDALDYTRPEALGAPSIVRTSMAHHVGMTLLALHNAIDLDRGQGIWQRRFLGDAAVRAAALLLDERVPRRYTTRQAQSDDASDPLVRAPRARVALREYDTADTPEPRVGLLGGQSYCVLLTNAGGGYSRSGDMDVYRWRADSTRDATGQWIYIRDVISGALWSAANQPVRAPTPAYHVSFAADRATFSRSDHGIDTRTEVVVVPRERTEIRRVTLTNRSRAEREIELTSYAEIVLTTAGADRAHPAFQNLFVETEWVPHQCAVLASRRPRSSGERRPWCAHVAAVGPESTATVTCETDRAVFLGRGRTVQSPAALDAAGPLACNAGAVLDPIAALRVRVKLEPGRSATVSFTTIVAETREEALVAADRHNDLGAAERALALSWTVAQIELRDLNVSADAAALYQELAGALIYPRESMRASQQERAANQRPQSALWTHGISGDWPIVLATIRAEVGLPSVRQLLMAHNYWRTKGVKADLIILNAKEPSYIQELQDQLSAMVVSSSEGGMLEVPGGVYIRRSDVLPPGDVDLLRAMASIHVVCDGVGLGEVVAATVRADAAPAPVRVPPVTQVRDAITLPALPEGNGYGTLTETDDYRIEVDGSHVPPGPWANVIANRNAGFCITERGGGFAWSENSYFYRLTPWFNDPVSDPAGEVIYLQDADTGHVWSPTPGPSLAKDDAAGPAPYHVLHAPGVSTFDHGRAGIRSSLSVSVAQEDPVKITRLRLQNEGAEPRTIVLTSYVELALGADRETTRKHVHTRRDDQTGAIFAQNFFDEDFATQVAFSWVSEPVTSAGGDRTAFIGRNGDLSAPAALAFDALSGSMGAGLDPCAALRCSVTLQPGEAKDVVVLLGAARGEDAVREIIARCGAPDAARIESQAAIDKWTERLGTIRVETPSRELDALVNQWSLYQALACRMWARSAIYQSSGAYGFRDQLQDGMAFVYAEPSVTRAHLLRAAGRQFKEGDVQHWWHEPSGRGVRTRFSDDLAWLPFVADHYVKVSGDTKVWDELAPYLEMRELEPHEHEVYDKPQVGPTRGTLYDHCVRALDKACTRGEHGLPLIGSGDWNDGMSRVGVLGKGESVWLAWFLIATLRRFARHAELRSDGAVVDRMRHRADEYAAAVERSAWDGAWYRRAYFDDGSPLGSSTSTEAKIDSIAQSWAVISEAGDVERARIAMKSVQEHLVRDDDRMILLLTPPFDHTDHDPGYIKGYLPGVRENGAQYTHAALWTIFAAAGVGDGDLAFHLYDLLNPLTHARSHDDADRYNVEPYVIAADVYDAPGHVGRGGWTWYTGSASWSYRAALEAMLGFTKRGDTLTMVPCIPKAWSGYTLHYRHGTATYDISVENPNGVSTGTASVTVDGDVCADGTIPLRDDGRVHAVTVLMGDH
ncbi:MAG: carbohydrate-binding protein [Gemmatimonadota bacterium]|nr:carbohydrate-binding protein [Gemmatimonadota bacterium]